MIDLYKTLLNERKKRKLPDILNRDKFAKLSFYSSQKDNCDQRFLIGANGYEELI